MGLSVEQAVKACVIIEQLVASDKKNKLVLPSAVRIKLAGSLRKVRPERDEYIKEHTELVKSLGSEVPDKPGAFKVKPENLDEFTKQNKAMLAVETDITLNSVTEADLLGDPEADKSQHNQIEVDLLADLYEVGLLKE